MSLSELPSWLCYRTGTRPIVIVAPHGGERAREIRRSDGMNDLYTAEIAHELAARLDAYAVVNAGLDRNDVDLNRISEVVEHAPEVLRVLRDAVTRAETASVAPLVLFVHGWNISSLACDIGIGLRETDGGLYGTQPTVSPAALRRFVEPLRDALAENGLEGFVGHRYPASGRDNVTQLFSGRHLGHAHPDVDHLARLALEGRVDAVQLELSIPLRWPGVYREGWLAAVQVAVDQYLGGPERAAIPHSAEGARKWATAQRPSAVDDGSVASQASTAGETVQAVLADGSGLFMGVEPAGAGGLAARVCIARPDGRLALFVCEAPWSGRPERFAAGGLEWRPGLNVHYSGPAVLYATHDAFVDLEGGLKSAAVVGIEVALSSARDGADKSVNNRMGYVRIDDETLEVSPPLVRRGGGRFAGEHGVRARMTLADSTGASIAIEDSLAARGASEPQRGDAGDVDAGASRIPARINFSDAGTRVTADAPVLGGVVEGVVTVKVPVYRPAGDGGVVKVVFGVAEMETNGGLGRRALFETVERFPPRRAGR